MKLQSILSDNEIINELSDNIIRKNIDSYSAPLFDIIPDEEMELFLNTEVKSNLDRSSINAHLESIILRHGRPALLIKDNTYEIPISHIWRDKLNTAKSLIEPNIPAVGLIEMKNHQYLSYAGTAWLVREDILVTNRHVAQHFSYFRDNQFLFKIGSQGKSIEPFIDYREEHLINESNEFFIDSVLHIEPEESFDLALLKVNPNTHHGKPLPSPISLQTSFDGSQEIDIVAIGYPTESTNPGVPTAIMDMIYDQKYGVKRLLPGKLKGLENEFIQHDCSTLTGSSGSVLLDISTGNAIGVHYAGVYGNNKFNEGISALAIERIIDEL